MNSYVKENIFHFLSHLQGCESILIEQSYNCKDDKMESSSFYVVYLIVQLGSLGRRKKNKMEQSLIQVDKQGVNITVKELNEIQKQSKNKTEIKLLHILKTSEKSHQQNSKIDHATRNPWSGIVSGPLAA